MELRERLEKYAQLVVERGVALAEGQKLVVSAPLDAADFTRMVVERAYEEGASYVEVIWHDDAVTRLGLDHADASFFQIVPSWMADRYNGQVRDGAAVLSILSDDPEAMKGADTDKLMARTVATHAACREYYDALDMGRTRWCIVGAASEPWATKVFPELAPEEAVKRLWGAILDASRVDEDPVAAWDAHRESFEARKRWLDGQHFDRLRYRAGNGTDLTVGLVEGSHWEGGGQEGADGTYFFPNIPTEEVFTSPDRMRADGVVHSALPLVCNGSPVRDFWIRFEGGKAVECGAEEGQDVLEGVIATDEGSCRLGECALVPYHSPIRQSGVLFYETLFDENASCHLALGRGFPETLEGGYDMTEEELLAAGVNDSAAHVDFMVGTEDLDVVGVRDDGAEVQVFSHGDWAVEL